VTPEAPAALEADSAPPTAGDAHAGALSNVVGYLIRRAHTIFALHWQLRFRHPQWPITPMQGGILVTLSQQPAMSQAMLARHLGVEAPTVQTAIDRLEKLGCLQRVRPDGERRSFHLQLTDSGRAALDAVQCFGQEREADLLAPLSPAERQQFLELLSRVVSHGQTMLRQGAERN
jgi:DNA-binding MarR family transcriptional regulator